MDSLEMDVSSDCEYDLEAVANEAIASILPQKSRPQYEKAYTDFRRWCDSKKLGTITTENVLLAYLEKKSKIVKPSTLWSQYSMLKATLNIKENVDVQKFPKIVPYLKNKNVGYRRKKSKVLTDEDISKFLKEADDKTFLLMKTVMIFGVCGALRRDELMKMKVSDVEDKDSVLIIKVPDTKTHSERVFIVSNEDNIKLVRKYQNLRPSNASSERFFLKYVNGRCFNQNVGINKIGEIPGLIAKWLKKENPKDYTGHCFRRSSATLLANGGGDITQIKRHGGWKSSNVAEGYIEDCINNKILISNIIQPSTKEISEPSTSTCNGTPGNKTDNISNLVKPSTASTSATTSYNYCNCTSKLASSLESGIIAGKDFSACTFNFHINI